MADKTTIVVDVEVEGVEQSIESVKDLKNAIKAAKDEQVKAASVFGESSKEYQKATQKVSQLKDKVDDLADSTKSLKGSGVERASEGFSQLGDGLRNLDFEKVKTGFSAMKTAIAAVGIGLLVQVVMYLYENFEKLSKGTGALATVLNSVGSVVKEVTQFFTDLIGVTSDATREIEAQTVALEKNTEAANENLNLRTSRLDRMIAIEKASGKNTTELELQKQRDIINTTKAIRDTIQAMLMRGGLDDEQQKKLQKQYDENEKRLLAAINAEKVIQITAQKAKEDKQKADNEKYLAEQKRLNDELVKLEFERRQQVDAIFKAENEKDKLRRQKELEDAKTDYENQKLLDIEIQNNKDAIDKANRDKKKADDLKDKQDADARRQQEYQLTKDSLQAAQDLTEIYFMFKSQSAAKGSKEEEENAKKAFQVNKALQLSTATINGIQAVQGAFTTATASPITTVFPAYPFVQAGLAGVFAAANIAKIAASKFSGSGSGSVSSPSAPSVSIPSAPTINTTEQKRESTTFDEQGNRTGNQVFKVNATIGVDEVTSKQNRVKVLEQQATF